MSDSPSPSRVRLGRIVVGVAIAVMLIAVLRMNARAIGGQPDDTQDFSQRRTDFQVRTEVHNGFPEFVIVAGTGFALLLLGVHLKHDPNKAR